MTRLTRTFVALGVVLTPVPGHARQAPPLPTLRCLVSFAHGFFGSYGSPPVPGDVLVLDLATLTARRDRLHFETTRDKAPATYIPVPLDHPFSLAWRRSDQGSGTSYYRFTSAEGRSSVSVDVDLSTAPAGHQPTASIVYESDIVRGVVFMACSRSAVR